LWVLFDVTRLELLWPQPLHKSWRKTLTLLLWAKLRAYECAQLWLLRLYEQQKEQQRVRLLLLM
jgi:hypothetical protein